MPILIKPRGHSEAVESRLDSNNFIHMCYNKYANNMNNKYNKYYEQHVQQIFYVHDFHIGEQHVQQIFYVHDFHIGYISRIFS